MQEVETVEIEGMQFQLLPMPCLTARKWDMQVLRLLAPLLGALDGIAGGAEEKQSPEEPPLEDPDADLAESEEDSAGAISGAEIKFKKVADAIGNALSALSDAQQEALINGLLFYAQRVDVTPGIPLSNTSNINKAFAGQSPVAIYTLVYHIARYNKFTPFAVLGTGGQIKGILGSLVPKAVQKGIRLDRLAP